MRRLVVVAIGLLLSACASKYRVDAHEAAATRLTGQASFYVVVPKDGAYGRDIYARSGEMTAQAVVSALARHVNRVEKATDGEDLGRALASAKQKGMAYVFEPMILHWEDRATEWSGIPDKITIKYSVYDVETGKVIASSVRSASSKWMTFGGDHPQDLLPVPTQQFVDLLF